MMKTNSREKGKRGEREFAALLREHGFEARRGQQFAGGEESPDVICTALPWLHIEVKRTQALNLADACAQAAGDCHGKPWVVAHRRNHAPWLITMRAELFFELVRDRSPVAQIEGALGEPASPEIGREEANKAKATGAHGGVSTRASRPTFLTADERGLTQSQSPVGQAEERQDACTTLGITPAAWTGEGESGELKAESGKAVTNVVEDEDDNNFPVAADAAAGCSNT